MNKWVKIFEDWWADHPSDDGAHDISHFQRVYKMALEINAGEDDRADPEVLCAAAYFHDVVNPPKNSSLRSKASTLSAEKAADILSDMGFPADKISVVQHAIIAHSFSANIAPETLEAKILQDADRMEALGALGVARNMYVSGMMGTYLFDPVDPLAKDRDLNDKKYAIDHFEVKLLKLPAMMKTKTGREIATERADFLIAFREQLLKEIGYKDVAS